MPEECAIGCLKSQINDRHCTKRCNVTECLYDGGDCLNAMTTRECYPGCDWGMVGNGVCNPRCQVIECSFDGGDCHGKQEDDAKYCAPGCPLTSMGDGHCDPECYVESCQFDYEDCPTPPPKRNYKECSPGCANNKVRDGTCDIECYVHDCEFDGGDCREETVRNRECAKGCKIKYVGDGWCDAACNHFMCNNDGGDCNSPMDEAALSLCDAGCTRDMLANGVCDPICNTFECGYDHGDCGSLETLTINANARASRLGYASRVDPKCEVIPPEMKYCGVNQSTTVLSSRACHYADKLMHFRQVRDNPSTKEELACFDVQTQFVCARGCVGCSGGTGQPVCSSLCELYKTTCEGIKGVDLTDVDCSNDAQFSSNPAQCTLVANLRASSASIIVGSQLLIMASVVAMATLIL
ncbi:hypothetical protein SAMD00019534_060850 [Acytostelium subglobosum LB1]|uniref:hypothetical protein n=1 Tax=Acytostelium subglobosum LB1 TaxID=1410327 RepID=UPI0006449BB1|nr:hypothetical protein SAMD00019534_060850 [Acytostelium subglobosum LB1]GAM22910.1 hypothetical protein SAMD00019534_060850 [Acytostelium subglobosum LB1]|eukprot:XP_012754137.1 hypothetical protein SAMD00019534_060850 [Acytostelium subglobosum LB1]